MNTGTKNTIQIALLLVGGYIVYNKFFAGKEQQYEDNANDAVNEVPNPAVNAMTFSLARAKVLANVLETAMRRSSILTADMDGTDEQAIFDVFAEIKNREDMRAVYKAFGVRVYTHGFLSATIKHDLIGMLRKELSSSDFNKIADKLAWVA